MTTRTHVVLVPGFVGFDALGQLEYYAGVTKVFADWREQRALDRAPTLHYFDNFPTASVAMRADRLRDYLLKRVARGEFSGDDCVTLVGHSTGGLDIRKAIFDLADDEERRVQVDATHDVKHSDVLHYVKHLVFLSVPHYGTKLGDFACMYGETAQALARNAALALPMHSEPLASLRRHAERRAQLSSSDLLLAVVDALNESDEDRAHTDVQRANAREARSELALWLEHISKDYAIVRDLRSASSHAQRSESPAHFSQTDRVNEMQMWQRHDITTQSYATKVTKRPELGARPLPWLPKAVRAGAPLLNAGARVLNGASALSWLRQVSILPSTLHALALPSVSQLLARHPDLVFKTFYTLCADRSDAFRVDDAHIAPDIQPLAETTGAGRAVPTRTIDEADSDGVVNTRSMLWPHEPDDPSRHPRFLVEADHGDIIGHYAPKRSSVPNGRVYDAYDIFPSGSGFHDARFHAVWTHIFDSCP